MKFEQKLFILLTAKNEIDLKNNISLLEKLLQISNRPFSKEFV